MNYVTVWYFTSIRINAKQLQNIIVVSLFQREKHYKDNDFLFVCLCLPNVARPSKNRVKDFSQI